MEAGSLPRASQFAFAVTSEKNRKKRGGAGWGWTDRAGIKEHKSSFACALTSYRVSKGPAGEDAPSNSAVILKFRVFPGSPALHSTLLWASGFQNKQQQSKWKTAGLIPPNSCHCFFLNQLFSYFKYEWVLLSSLVTLPRAGGFRRETKGI